jgi:hypothetical protein
LESEAAVMPEDREGFALPLPLNLAPRRIHLVPPAPKAKPRADKRVASRLAAAERAVAALANARIEPRSAAYRAACRAVDEAERVYAAAVGAYERAEAAAAKASELRADRESALKANPQFLRLRRRGINSLADEKLDREHGELLHEFAEEERAAYAALKDSEREMLNARAGFDSAMRQMSRAFHMERT